MSMTSLFEFRQFVEVTVVMRDIKPVYRCTRKDEFAAALKRKAER
jgi:hypothetical protein